MPQPEIDAESVLCNVLGIGRYEAEWTLAKADSATRQDIVDAYLANDRELLDEAIGSLAPAPTNNAALSDSGEHASEGS